MTEKQRRFVEAYQGKAAGNATEAARLAGYKGNYKTLQNVGSVNLSKPAIAAAIDAGIKAWRHENSLPLSADLKGRLVDIYGDVLKAQRALESAVWALIEDGDAKRALLESRRGHLSGTTRYAVLHRAGFKCQSCGAKPLPSNSVTLHLDHVVPLAWGGSDDADNLQSLCCTCNLSKGDRFAFDHNEDQQLTLFSRGQL